MGRWLIKFSKAIVKYYWLVIIIVVIITGICLCAIIFFSNLPDFKDPRNGFETRGTDISDNSLAYEALMKKTRGVVDYYNRRFKGDELGHFNATYPGKGDDEEDYDAYDDNYADDDENDEDRRNMEKSNNLFFCGRPEVGHAKLIYQRTDRNRASLMDVSSIKSMCILENRLITRGFDSFNRYCDKLMTTIGQVRNCCRSWSLGNYIALLSGRQSCLNISQNDVDHFQEWFRVCEPDMRCVNQTCDEFRCNESMHILQDARGVIDKWYVEGGGLRYVVSHLPLSAGLASRKFYDSIRGEAMVEDGVKLVAMDFDLKYHVFDEFLTNDLFKAAPGFICIIGILVLYTGSLLITILTLVNIFVTLVISFSIYHFIFQVQFFPFLNLLTAIILLATGVDAIFVSLHVLSLKARFNEFSRSKDNFSELLPQSFSGFTRSSAATFLAYLSGWFSDVAVLRCFALFASLSVAVHFFVTIFFIPSVFVLNNKISCKIFTDLYSVMACLENVTSRLQLYVTSSLIFFIHKFRFILITAFSLLTLILVILFSIHFQRFLPSVRDFKVLVSWHPFEMFDSIVADNFISEDYLDKGMKNLSLRFIWGVRPMKTARYLVDEVEGGFVPDPLDLSSKKAQKFMVEFCKKLRASKYYTRQVGMSKNNCFMQDLRTLMERGCRDINGASLKPCCATSKFPYKRKVFTKCLQRLLPTLAKNSLLYSNKKTAGLRFNTNFSYIEALVVEFVSNVPYDLDYQRMKEFYYDMRNFTLENIRRSAPEGLKNGWFSSDLAFFDLQQSLFRGIIISLVFVFCAVSVICAFFMGLSLITVFSILSITLSTTTSIILLLLSGWTFNVFESMAFSLVVGLSIDFTLHNAAAFLHAEEGASRVDEVASMNGAVFLASLTTFIVGACYQGSIIMAYKQLSSLLMTVISLSWIYSTLFFLPLLSTLDVK